MKKWKVTYYIGIVVIVLCLIGIVIYMAMAQKSKASLTKAISDAMIEETKTTGETIPYPDPKYETIVTDPESGEDIDEIVVATGPISPTSYQKSDKAAEISPAEVTAVPSSSSISGVNSPNRKSKLFRVLS